MKNGKATSLSSEMVKETGEAGADTIPDLENQVIVEGVIPVKWDLSIIVNC